MNYFLFCCVSGLCEVNSLGFSVVSFDETNVLKVSLENGAQSYKIFNFCNLVEFEKKIVRDWKALGANISVDHRYVAKGFARPATDTWSVGILLAKCLVYINFDEDPSTIDQKWLKNFKKDSRINSIEKEILSRLLDSKSSTRVKVSDLLTNHYFLQILKYRKDLQLRLFQSYRLPELDSLGFINHLVKNITLFEAKSQASTKIAFEQVKIEHFEEESLKQQKQEGFQIKTLSQTINGYTTPAKNSATSQP